SDDQESEENDKEYDNHYQDDDEDKGITTHCQYKLAHLLRGWFSYRRMASSETRFEQKSIPSRVTYGFLGSFKNVVRLYSNKYDSQRETWKAV
ncbi:unnamed protein product, partial [Ilex paraguariensis]